MSKKTVHMSMTKDFVIMTIKRYGAKEVLPNWKDTDEAAIKAIEEDERQLYNDCPKTHKDGSCACYEGDE